MKKYQKIILAVSWLIPTILSGIIGNEFHQYYEELMGQKNSEIDYLTEKVIALEGDLAANKELLNTIQGGVTEVSQGISLQFNVTPAKQIDAIKKFRKSVNNLTIVKAWEKERNKNILNTPTYFDFTSNISDEEILDSMYSVCELYSFHLWLSEEDALQLPRRTLLEFSKYFNDIEIHCDSVPENIARIRADSWFIDVVYGATGLMYLSVDSVYDNYNHILKASRKLLRELNNEEAKLIKNNT